MSMDRQKVYNKVRKHLLSQNRQALEPREYAPGHTEEVCRYRTYDPNAKRVLKCAIGCLIPFRLYDPKIEGGAMWSDKVVEVLIQAIPGYETSSPLFAEGNDASFLNELQEIHDSSTPDVWRECLNRFAARHGLDVVA